MKISLRSAVCAALLLIAYPLAQADQFRGRVVGITDGDTVTVLGSGGPLKIRLAGIDAPEKRQAFGQVAKKRMSDLAFQRDAVVRWERRDRYGRIIGVVFVNGRDVGLALVESGLAWHFKRYAKEQSLSDRLAYAAAEDRARAARAGLWREQHVVAPWEFRRERRH